MPTLRDGVTWPVRTARLVIRPGTADDLEALWEIRRIESVSEWLTRWPQSLEQHRAHAGTPESLAKTLVVELDGRIVGELMIAVGDGWAQAEVASDAKRVEAELGWVLHPDAEGHGYATEAVREAIRICFDALGLRRVTAGCFAANEASWRLMERVGMRREQAGKRDGLHRTRGWLDGYTYALLADDWRAPN